MNFGMSLLASFWADEQGMILSAETVLLGTIGIVGATVGLGAMARSVDSEMTDLARSFRSLDQSYHIEGLKHGSAWTAGSGFQQEPVEVSLKKLDAEIERLRKQEQRDQPQKPEEPKKKKKNQKTEAEEVEVDLDQAV